MNHWEKFLKILPQFSHSSTDDRMPRTVLSHVTRGQHHRCFAHAKCGFVNCRKPLSMPFAMIVRWCLTWCLRCRYWPTRRHSRTLQNADTRASNQFERGRRMTHLRRPTIVFLVRVPVDWKPQRIWNVPPEILSGESIASLPASEALIMARRHNRTQLQRVQQRKPIETWAIACRPLRPFRWFSEEESR